MFFICTAHQPIKPKLPKIHKAKKLCCNKVTKNPIGIKQQIHQLVASVSDSTLLAWWRQRHPAGKSLCLSSQDMLRRVLKRANRMGFTYYGYDLDHLDETSQYKLFRRSRSERHCLHHLFTVKPRPPGAMHLRQRGHDFLLPNIRYEFNKRHFIARALFYYV